MNCEVFAVIDKNEQYARGWLRLHETAQNTSTAAEMGQYALNLQKLKQEHQERCWLCSQRTNTAT